MDLIDFIGQLQPLHRNPEIFHPCGFIRRRFGHLHCSARLVPELFSPRFSVR